MSGRCEIHAAMGIRSLFSQMVKHVLTDYVFNRLAAHTCQIYWTVVAGHVFVTFFKRGLILAFLQSFSKVPVSRLC